MEPNEGSPNKVLACEETVEELSASAYMSLFAWILLAMPHTIIKSFVIITQHSSFMEAKLCERSASSKLYMKRVFAASKLGDCAITDCQ